MARWRSVPGYGDVFADRFGHVKRQHPQTKTWLVSLGIQSQTGYRRMHFHGKRWPVHRLIALAFIPNPQSFPEVNHKNGIKNDNRASNLEWCTCRHNIRHAVATGLRVAARGERNGRCKLTEDQVRDIYQSVILRGEKHRIIAARYGIAPCYISFIARRLVWKHLDFDSFIQPVGGRPIVDLVKRYPDTSPETSSIHLGIRVSAVVRSMARSNKRTIAKEVRYALTRHYFGTSHATSMPEPSLQAHNRFRTK